MPVHTAFAAVVIDILNSSIRELDISHSPPRKAKGKKKQKKVKDDDPIKYEAVIKCLFDNIMLYENTVTHSVRISEEKMNHHRIYAYFACSIMMGFHPC